MGKATTYNENLTYSTKVATKADYTKPQQSVQSSNSYQQLLTTVNCHLTYNHGYLAKMIIKINIYIYIQSYKDCLSERTSGGGVHELYCPCY